MKVQSNKL